jgi:hypothetical protein
LFGFLSPSASPGELEPHIRCPRVGSCPSCSQNEALPIESTIPPSALPRVAHARRVLTKKGNRKNSNLRKESWQNSHPRRFVSFQWACGPPRASCVALPELLHLLSAANRPVSPCCPKLAFTHSPDGGERRRLRGRRRRAGHVREHQPGPASLAPGLHSQETQVPNGPPHQGRQEPAGVATHHDFGRVGGPCRRSIGHGRRRQLPDGCRRRLSRCESAPRVDLADGTHPCRRRRLSTRHAEQHPPTPPPYLPHSTAHLPRHTLGNTTPNYVMTGRKLDCPPPSSHFGKYHPKLRHDDGSQTRQTATHRVFTLLGFIFLPIQTQNTTFPPQIVYLVERAVTT